MQLYRTEDSAEPQADSIRSPGVLLSPVMPPFTTKKVSTLLDSSLAW